MNETLCPMDFRSVGGRTCETVCAEKWEREWAPAQPVGWFDPGSAQRLGTLSTCALGPAARVPGS